MVTPFWAILLREFIKDMEEAESNPLRTVTVTVKIEQQSAITVTSEVEEEIGGYELAPGWLVKKEEAGFFHQFHPH
jgi:hypothetical protein